MKLIVSPTPVFRNLCNWTIVSLLIVIFHVGCGQSPNAAGPATFEVTGRVVDKSGKQVSYGSVEFVSLEDGKTQAVGKLQPDGTFSLHTYIDKSVVPGAIEGSHEANFHPGIRGQAPFRFKGPINVTAGTNHFELTYPYDTATK